MSSTTAVDHTIEEQQPIPTNHNSTDDSEPNKPKKKKKKPASNSSTAAVSSDAVLTRSQELIANENEDWKITIDPQRGRSAIAKRALPPGHTVLIETAAGWILRADTATTESSASSSAASTTTAYCAECCRLCTTPIHPPCCQRVIYCSPACQEKASSVHALCCQILPTIPTMATKARADPDLIHLVLKLVANWSLEQKESSRAVTTEESKNSGELGKCIGKAVSTVQHSRWRHVLDLVSHIESQSEEWKGSIRAAMQALRAELQRCQAFTGTMIPDEKTLVELCSRINSNSHAIFDNHGGSNRVIGLGLFPTTSILNHSCYPSCFFSSTGISGGMIVRTLRAVNAGEELTVPYLDLYQPRLDRMMELWKDKHFWCSCQRCVAEEKSPLKSNHDQISTWLQLGAIYCPTCKVNQLAHDWEDEDGKKKTKKKKKTATATESSTTTDASTSTPTPAAATSSSSTTSPANSSVYDRFISSFPPLSALPDQIGLVVWRGTKDEIRASLAAEEAKTIMSRSVTPPQPKSWHCLRAGCGAKFTASEVEGILAPLYRLYQQASRLKSERRFVLCLELFETLLTTSQELIPPYHVLQMLSLIPMLNISRHLDQTTKAHSILQGILTRMYHVFPPHLPEISEFLVAMGENEQQRLQELKADDPNATTNKVVYETNMVQAYTSAYQIRLIACGADHPRTLAIPERFRTAS